MRTVLFYRDFRRFHGGHLKVWHYFNHVLASPTFSPRIWFSAKSTWSSENPWVDAQPYIVDHRNPVRPDVVFVAGRDWRMLDQSAFVDPSLPVLNLVQHVRHADETSTRFEYLSRRAIRLCVGEEVAQALRETGRTEGPVIVIPNGVDLELMPAASDTPPVDLLIVALKQPELGRELASRLARPGRRLDVLPERLPRPEFLHRIGRARATLFLPNQTEGFYLPALEGMALGTLVVCPDCVGNRSFCLPGQTAFRPDYTPDDLVAATEAALALPAPEADRLRANARQTAEAHSLPRERRMFLDVLHNLDQLW